MRARRGQRIVTMTAVPIPPPADGDGAGATPPSLVGVVVAYART